MGGDAGHSESLTRIHNSILVSGERRVLFLLAERLPLWVTPDLLTATGVAGAGLIAIGCLAANLDPAWYLLAVAGLVINWFGDSLDGTLARLRRIERPRYGFFVDQFADVAAHFLMLFGLGLSPLMHFNVALMALLGSLAVMFYGHLKLQFSRTWQVSHYGVGPTELRILIGGGLLLGVADAVPTLDLPFATVSLFDVVGVLVFAAALVCIGLMFIADRAKIAAIDPPRHRQPAEVVVTPLSND